MCHKKICFFFFLTYFFFPKNSFSMLDSTDGYNYSSVYFGEPLSGAEDSLYESDRDQEGVCSKKCCYSCLYHFCMFFGDIVRNISDACAASERQDSYILSSSSEIFSRMYSSLVTLRSERSDIQQEYQDGDESDEVGIDFSEYERVVLDFSQQKENPVQKVEKDLLGIDFSSYSDSLAHSYSSNDSFKSCKSNFSTVTQ